jgi:hypothetical protein
MGVLSTQSLLFAIGLGAGAIPMAAALNWVLKDGIGQLGGVVFAASVNNRFDADCRRFKFFSGAAMSLACLVEMLTPLVPHLFLPLASVSNIAKNVAWITSSATRAAIHRSMTRRENLADVTAKAASQSTSASVLGTGIGILISSVIGSEGLSFPLFATFCSLASLQMYFNYQSLNFVVLNSLSQQRLELLVLHYLFYGEVASPAMIGDKEQFLLKPKPVFSNCRIKIGGDLEPVLSKSLPLFQLLSPYGYMMSIDLCGSSFNVNLIWDQRAVPSDCLVSFLHAGIVCRRLSQKSISSQSLDGLIQECFPDEESRVAFLGKMQSSEWDIQNLLLEFTPHRYQIIE